MQAAGKGVVPEMSGGLTGVYDIIKPQFPSIVIQANAVLTMRQALS